MLIAYRGAQFVLTGDIGSSTEQTILASGTPVAADVLKVAHHGSRYSSNSSFLQAVAPQLAVISVGADNPYGHPAQETLDRLTGVGARLLRTDRNGTVIVTTDGLTFELDADFVVFLPLVAKPAPAAPQPETTCWVSDATPSQYTTVTVYGELTQGGAGLAGVPMEAEWHFRTVTRYCNGISASDGTASCSRQISAATPGYTVYVYVTMTYSGQEYKCTTWFTPHG